MRTAARPPIQLVLATGKADVIATDVSANHL